MASNFKRGNAAVNAECEAVTTLLNTGFLRIYDGAQPANVDTAVGAQVLLAELRFGNPSFATPTAGVMLANAVTADAGANATGTATWYRALKSDGTTPVMDGSAGTTDVDCILNSANIQVNAAVSVLSMSYTANKG